MRLRPTRRRRGVAAMLGVLAVSALVAVGCAPTGPVSVDTPEQVDVQLPDDTVAQLEDAVTSAMATTGASGAIVGVWAPWSGVWVEALGSQTPGGAAVTADMTFPAGRMTRAMTCDVLYQVAAAGIVRLDDSVSTYVAGVPNLSDVTLEQLCQSTSGIGAYRDRLSAEWLQNPERTWNPRELAGYGLGEGRSGEPGTAYRDSDAGYVLLGLALERATQKSAAELVDEYVVDRLGLANTRFEAFPAGTTPLTGLYSPAVKGGGRDCTTPTDVTATSFTTGYTDSGVATDIEDLGTYVQALAAGSLGADGNGRFDTEWPVSSSAPSWFTISGGTLHAGGLVGQVSSRQGYLVGGFSDPDTGLTVAFVLNNSTAKVAAAQSLGFELAAIASKAPAAAGQKAPEAGLPWTAEQQHAAVAENPICAPAE
ncbi:serine hydrolase domain-containing protein [Microbacterium terrae]|nr:serine hydrolase domain-containing protein [Microbacterium terrae]